VPEAAPSPLPGDDTWIPVAGNERWRECWTLPMTMAQQASAAAAEAKIIRCAKKKLPSLFTRFA